MVKMRYEIVMNEILLNHCRSQIEGYVLEMRNRQKLKREKDIFMTTQTNQRMSSRGGGGRGMKAGENRITIYSPDVALMGETFESTPGASMVSIDGVDSNRETFICKGLSDKCNRDLNQTSEQSSS